MAEKVAATVPEESVPVPVTVPEESVPVPVAEVAATVKVESEEKRRRLSTSLLGIWASL